MKKKITLIFLLTVISLGSVLVYTQQGEANEVSTRNGGGNECYQYVHNIMQTKNYNCGTTTVLQTLYGMGFEDNVPGNTDVDKINHLDTVYLVDELEQSDLDKLVEALNDYTTGLRTFQKSFISIYVSMAEFEDMIATSLTNCKPVMAMVNTLYLSYYNGAEYGHYVSVDYINRTTDVVRIVDCNYNTAYYGVHYVSLTELYNATCGGAIIH